MKDVYSVPFAPSLIESMRSLGYSFESAVADIIDNSISAEAKRIDVRIQTGKSPYLIVFDDGCGMSDDKLRESMRYGSQNPLVERSKNDLGRFGLGLKSASLSQCRQLTVVSKQSNEFSCYKWDLDYIIQQKDWKLQKLEGEEIDGLPCIKNMFENVETGTYVLWQCFDRLKKSSQSLESALIEAVDITIDHLSLIYHRYLESGLKIYVNNRQLDKIDPFLTSNKKTTRKREVPITIHGETIKVVPYILPHKTHLKSEDYKKIGGKEKLYSGQGFYIYRNKRLIIWGTWFRLQVKSELGKLARVQVDIPNTLDDIWNIDIKKNTASLPYSIKNQLISAVKESVGTSVTKNEFRGRRTKKNNMNFVWNRLKNRDTFSYEINRDLPQIKMLEDRIDEGSLRIVESLLKQIEENLPIESLYVDNANDVLTKEKQESEQLVEEIKEVYSCLGENRKTILEVYLMTEPYCNYQEVTDYIQELINNE
ncbi:ATP-binding protein [Catenibacterium mitsuokai]|uniref:ATP-binding protein n=1 Tax=Catenibacterium mitsuokai TaxID=100886 RepID=UPI00241D760E|nr:ATP-binding protein [Catenibacterium mitsuokai]MBN2930480.1 ATP-binding protein [Catenibacterium mitsuokai]